MAQKAENEEEHYKNEINDKNVIRHIVHMKKES